MSPVSNPHSNLTPPQLDLQALHDTLLYISSDIEHVDGLEALAACVREALLELEKIKGADSISRPPPFSMTFLPARIE